MGCVQSNSKEQETVPDRSRRRLSVLKGADQQIEEGASKEQQKQAASKFETLLELLPAGEKRFAIAGLQPSGVQKGFEDKCTSKASNFASDQSVDTPEFGIGYACKKGLKPESPNQDDFFILQVDNTCGIYGVFDGHGPFGHEVSHFVHQLLPAILLRSDNFQNNPKEAISRAFTKTHAQAAKANERQVMDCTLSGTTGTVVVARDNELHVGHVGDSRAVLGVVDGDGKLVAKALTEDHKPGLPSEKARIHKNGGQVRCLNGDVNERVFLKNKLYPGLAMSRSIGDLVGGSAGVTSEPELQTVEVSTAHQYLLICSDGVWEFITNQEALDIVAAHGDDLMAGAEELSQEAWRRWINEENSVVDDITVVLVKLNQSPPKSLDNAA